MLLAGEGFRDVCACRRPRGSSSERWWDGVLAGGSRPSHALDKRAGVPGAGTAAGGCGTGSQQVLVLAVKTGARWHLGLGVKNAQLASNKRGEPDRWQETAGGDTVGVPPIPPGPCLSSSLPLGNDPDATGSVL